METKLNAIDQMVLNGQITEAVEKYFSEAAITKDTSGLITSNKSEALQKLSGFVNGIKEVKEISLLHSTSIAQISYSEFRFHFLMHDDTEILWHEIIKRTWQEDQVIEEQYFQN